jgi:hypothetical protein
MSNNKQQTAVEWLWEQIDEILPFSVDTETGIKLYNAKEQAKEMEKEQMWAYIKEKYCIGPKSLEFHKLEFEQYYNETYGGNK